MKFGPVPTAEARGGLLAHALTVDGRRLAKGHALSGDDLRQLQDQGVSEVVVARLDPDDVTEDDAAARIALALAADGISVAPPGTGRANLHAEASGVFLPDRSLIDAVNRIHPGITVATLAEYTSVEAHRMLATVKIIPLAVPGAAVAEAERVLSGGTALRLKRYRARGVGLVQTELPTIKATTLDKTRRILEGRLSPSGSILLREVRCPHDAGELARRLSDATADEELTIVFGASAVIDEADVVPDAIRRAGGEVRHLGMPVDPGNLLLLGQIGPRIVLGAPGCARSPIENGFDWVLTRLMADLQVGREEIVGLGVGGLLMEIATRPQAREDVVSVRASTPRVHALVLAAGRSSRMGGPNKLLARFGGEPLVRRTVETALASRACAVTVVTGHMADEIGAALEGTSARIVHNEDFAAGLSTSLRRGFAVASQDSDGVLVLLADQPLLTSADLDRMIEAFRPAGIGSIVLATDDGRRANPVILSSIFANAISTIEGDVGARAIVQSSGELVREVELGRAASLDVDTPDVMREAGGVWD
ncbi:NTP transferase domain-containing protein [Aureimonas phyllosphaerae]|uniref:Molybdenum cofactor cytidylyltransferase n=1 Tax=Aureimonas phyllosphaerae TaxID=1166078 RepID=A0A7W6BUG2_9HYPH|nr:molybdopterin-binding/glycosyltransferase family 2 protein [Aureimonas phyllosphaerae]MBB3935278.1 molybdenum cofactor cytidylyltransferase [Aureimonas phyllosphaerae]MBB3959286.1 molybdenum cofactor cytidylyltransferase [Aureimonas phyllosphaerae]SFF05280.1 molybdopterin molybdochelatase /molybdenum cofactor cytidylyltransferase [Aureimonas phyllosphaerae]